MAKYVAYPNLAAEMARKGENAKDLESLLHIERSAIFRKLQGKAKWTLGDVYVLCEHYKMDCYKLFKKNEKEGEKK